MADSPVLLDVTCLCDRHTDDALELIYKAIGDDGGAAGWDPRVAPYINRLVTLFEERGLTRLGHVQVELSRWLAGEMHDSSIARAPRPAGVMERWSSVELGLARLYLQSLPPAEFTVDDWMMLVDYIVQRYLPPGDMRAEADWLATRSAIMGRVMAAMADLTPDEADTVLVALPGVEEMRDEFGMSPLQSAIIEYGRARCAENVTALTDSLRHAMRKLIVDYQFAQFVGDPGGAMHSLQTRLLDEFGLMNRDWRRIAVTEAAENLNQGFVASVPFGQKIRRVEKYHGACAFCRSIDGTVMTVVDPAKADKNGDTEVWVGKTNIGRSASPRKRVDGELVEREPEERLWLAAGTMHPHCRGAWVKASKLPDDPVFEAWLKARNQAPR